MENEGTGEAEAAVDGLASRDALPSGALEALREVLRRARHRAALVDALAERAGREDRLATALERFVWLAAGSRPSFGSPATPGRGRPARGGGVTAPSFPS